MTLFFGEDSVAYLRVVDLPNLCRYGSIVGRVSFFERVFLHQRVIPLGHLFGYLNFLYAFIHFSSKSVVFAGEFLKPNSIYAIKARNLPVCYLFKRWLEPVRVYIYLRVFFKHLQLCFHVVYPFGFSYYDLSVPTFCSKIFLPLSHPDVDMASPILHLSVGRMFFVVLECSVLSLLFGLVSVSF